MNDLFKQDDFRQQYELAKSTGDKRFGSECKHTETKGGYCTNCLRKVVSLTGLFREPCRRCDVVHTYGRDRTTSRSARVVRRKRQSGKPMNRLSVHPLSLMNIAGCIPQAIGIAFSATENNSRRHNNDYANFFL